MSFRPKFDNIYDYGYYSPKVWVRLLGSGSDMNKKNESFMELRDFNLVIVIRLLVSINRNEII